MKNSFVLYTEFREQFSELTDREKGILISAIFEYAETGTVTDMSKVVKMAFISIRQHLDRNGKKYQDCVDNGKKGGAPIGNSNAKKQSETTKNNQEQECEEKNNLNDNVNDNENVNEKDTPPLPPKGKIEREVDVFLNFSSGNNDLYSALCDFEKMRNKIKSPMTDRARKMFLAEIEKLSTDPDTQIKLLEQSILNNWKSVYPLKEYDNSNNEEEERYYLP